MTSTIATQSTFEELDYRENDGIQVSLLWSKEDNRLAVVVVDTKGDETFELSVQAHQAKDVFDHPFAYAASRLVTEASLPINAFA